MTEQTPTLTNEEKGNITNDPLILDKDGKALYLDTRPLTPEEFDAIIENGFRANINNSIFTPEEIENMTKGYTRFDFQQEQIDLIKKKHDTLCDAIDKIAEHINECLKWHVDRHNELESRIVSLEQKQKELGHDMAVALEEVQSNIEVLHKNHREAILGLAKYSDEDDKKLQQRINTIEQKVSDLEEKYEDINEDHEGYIMLLGRLIGRVFRLEGRNIDPNISPEELIKTLKD